MWFQSFSKNGLINLMLKTKFRRNAKRKRDLKEKQIKEDRKKLRDSSKQGNRRRENRIRRSIKIFKMGAIRCPWRIII